MNCGHRGIPYRSEEKRVSRLLRKSGFIPMLENPSDKKSAKEQRDLMTYILAQNTTIGSTVHPQVKHNLTLDLGKINEN